MFSVPLWGCWSFPNWDLRFSSLSTNFQDAHQGNSAKHRTEHITKHQPERFKCDCFSIIPFKAIALLHLSSESCRPQGRGRQLHMTGVGSFKTLSLISELSLLPWGPGSSRCSGTQKWASCCLRNLGSWAFDCWARRAEGGQQSAELQLARGQPAGLSQKAARTASTDQEEDMGSNKREDPRWPGGPGSGRTSALHGGPRAELQFQGCHGPSRAPTS